MWKGNLVDVNVEDLNKVSSSSLKNVAEVQ